MTTTYEPNKVLSNEEFKVVGTRPIRPDGADKVTGRAQYGADYNPADLLYAKVLRSPHAHAKIKSINTSKAESLKGVLAVVTGADTIAPQKGESADFGLGPQPMKYLRDNAIATDKVLYQGHAVAAVAAQDVHTAEEAVNLIEVEYDVLEPVLTAPEAMAKTAPILHSDLTTD